MRSSGVRGEWWQEGGERGSSTSVENTEYETGPFFFHGVTGP